MLRPFALVPMIVLAGLTPSLATEVGLIGGTFAATTDQSGQGPGCTGLLITGQFVAPTPGYQLTLAEDPAQTTITVYAMKLTATPSQDVVTQVLTPSAVVHWDPTFANCPYGVSISYETQSLIVPLSPITLARSAQ